MTTARVLNPNMAEVFQRLNITTYFCGFIGCFVEYNHVWFRKIASYDERGRRKWKFPGGDCESFEVPQEVGFREYREEVTRPHSKVELNLATAELIHQRFGHCEKFPGGFHAKLFFMFPEKAIVSSGGDMCFRTKLRPEDDGDILGPSSPEMAEHLWQDICVSHKTALAKSILHLSRIEDYSKFLTGRLLTEVKSFIAADSRAERERMDREGIPLIELKQSDFPIAA